MLYFISNSSMFFHFFPPTGEKNNKALLFTSDDRVFGVGENVNGCLCLDSIVAFHGLPTEIPALAKKGVKGKIKFTSPLATCSTSGNYESVEFIVFEKL